MTIQTAWVPVTTSPVALADGGGNGIHVKVYNAGGTTIYLGGSAVAGTSGFAMVGSAAPVSLELEAHETLYAIAASGTASVQVLKGGV